MRKVAILQRYIPQYRREFFNRLRDTLIQKEIDLQLIYGQPNERELKLKDAIDLDWAIHVPSKIFKLGRSELYWQPVFHYLKGVDLVIVEQASKLLINYLLLLQSWFGTRKIAFWGHGKNFQSITANRFGEWIKRLVSTRVHWWFAYNDLSVKVVQEMGYPAERITSVQNAVDTLNLHSEFLNLPDDVRKKIQVDLGLQSSQVCLFIGGMNPGKQISFLLESLHYIREQINDFEMIFVGSGVDALLVSDAAKHHPWIHYVEPKFASDKIPYFSLSKYVLMPYSAGLVLLDSFALETPLITINSPLHGPEIGYLENGINGIMVAPPCDPKVFAEKVIDCLKDDHLHERLVENCQKSYQKYSIEGMVENFSSGIEKALSI